MARCRFSHIISFYGICVEQDHLSIVMEYMSKGSLYDVLHDEDINLPWELRLKIAKGITRGLDYLHNEKILHRDLKSLNVLLDDNYHPKISDFGLSRIRAATSASTTKKSAVGTLRWMDPTLFGHPKYSQATDIYSLGMTLWEVVTRKIPFNHIDNEMLLMAFLSQGGQETVPADCPKAFSDLIKACWNSNQNMRPSTTQIVATLEQVKMLFDGKIPQPLAHAKPVEDLHTLSKTPLSISVASALKHPIVATSLPTTCIKRLKGFTHRIFCLASLPDCRVATGCEDGSIKIMDVITEDSLRIIKAHASPIRILVSLPDGKLASASDTSVKIWEWQETGECQHTFKSDSHIKGMALLSDGTLAVAYEKTGMKYGM